MKTTIQEVLAWLKYAEPKITKKGASINANIARPANQIDPMLTTLPGGTPEFIAREMKSIHDQTEEWIARRVAIQRSNLDTVVDIDGKKRTVAEWIVWKREVYPQLNAIWSQALGQIRRINAAPRKTDEPLPVFNIQETNIVSDLEALQNTYQKLDGLLSLNNATVTVEI